MRFLLKHNHRQLKNQQPVSFAVAGVKWLHRAHFPYHNIGHADLASLWGKGAAFNQRHWVECPIVQMKLDSR